MPGSIRPISLVVLAFTPRKSMLTSVVHDVTTGGQIVGRYRFRKWKPSDWLVCRGAHDFSNILGGILGAIQALIAIQNLLPCSQYTNCRVVGHYTARPNWEKVGPWFSRDKPRRRNYTSAQKFIGYLKSKIHVTQQIRSFAILRYDAQN
jgi:hypothetical protein